jgi:hypothetical protein
VNGPSPRRGQRGLPATRHALFGALLLLAGACSREAGPDATQSPGGATLPTLADTVGIDVREQGGAADAAEGGALRVDRLDPCALITRQEAEAIVRAPLLEAVQYNLGTERPSCTYGAVPSGPTAQVQIYVGEGAESLIALHRRLGGEIVELEELGEGAFLRHTTLHYQPSGVPIVISVVRLVDATTLHPAMITAARVVAERMASSPPADAGDAPLTAQ